MEEKRQGEYSPVYENNRGTYLLSSRDLCMIEHLDKLADTGVDCFKIEGRMKGINYVAGVVKTYREAVDRLGEGPYRVDKQWIKELSMFSSRGYTTGMFFDIHSERGYNHDEEKIYRMSHELVGVVESLRNGKAVVSLRNTLKIGDKIEYLSIGINNNSFDLTEIYDTRGNTVESGKNGDIVLLPVHKGVKENDLIRRPLKTFSG
jgi:putative protease